MKEEFVDLAAGRAHLAVPEGGTGPGLVLFPDIDDDGRRLHELRDLYAGEGYVVLSPETLSALNGAEQIRTAIAALRARRECIGKVGALGFGLGGKLAWLAAAETPVDCAVSYYGFGIDFGLNLVPRIRCPFVMHFAENDPQIPPEAVARVLQASSARPKLTTYVYTGAAPGFERKGGPHYDKPAAGLAHSRTIGLLRGAMGPHYDLEALWENHTKYEFAIRDVEATMLTMVADPYVNHVPVMTGGVGQEELARNARPISNSCRCRGRSAPTGWSTRWWYRSPMTSRSTGCCRECRQPAAMLRSQPSSSSISAAANYAMSTFIGIKRACSCRSGCLTPRACRSQVARRRKNCSTKPVPRIP